MNAPLIASRPATLEPRRAAMLCAGVVGILIGGGALIFSGPEEDWRDLSRTPFKLEPCLVPRNVIAAAAKPDGFPRLESPTFMSAGEAEAFKLGHSRLLVPGDRVIGVVVDGEAFAFPVQVLEWHEVVNVTLAGRPVAVTYSGLTECARAWDRRVDQGVLELQPSGLLANMNTLMFERNAERPSLSSLWSQIDGRAVAGPRAAKRTTLTPIPAELAGWGAWRTLYPGTKVLTPDMRVAKLYKRSPYSAYMGRSSLPFPVAPLPPAGLAPKERVIAVEVGGVTKVYAVARIASRASASGSYEVEHAGVPLEFEVHRDPAGVQPDTVRVTAPAGKPVMATSALWFAWHAFHPTDKLVD